MNSGIAKALTRLFPIKESRWPTLARLASEQRVDTVDIKLAETLLKSVETPSEAVAFLICHLSLSVRRGHMCLVFHNEALLPGIEACWNGENEEQLTDAESLLIQTQIAAGFRELPAHLLQTALKLDGNRLYFQRYWQMEQELLVELNRLKTAQPLQTLATQTLGNDLGLQPEQRNAIEAAIQSTVFFLSGGPGTGKTYTAGHLIRIYWESLSEAERQQTKISLAAPTGKAASALQASLQNALKSLEMPPALTTQTLHALLGLKFNRFQTLPTKLTSHLILIDESSMIDTELFSTLLKAVPSGARVIFLGDPHQLPPIDAGAPFAGLIQEHAKHAISHVSLKKCLRAELEEIVTLAAHIKSGEWEQARAILSSGTSQGVRFLTLIPQSAKNITQQLCHYAKTNFPELEISDKQNLFDLLQTYQRFRLLSPMRKGLYGVDTLNALLLRTLRTYSSQNRRMALPIIITKNDPQSGLFNGECGLWLKVQASGEDDPNSISPEDQILLPDPQQPGALRSIPALLAPAFDLAFCLSVHKSQGSEFEKVLLLLPKGSDCFGREMLYTAVTRAKRELEIWCQEEGLFDRVIQNSSQRISGL